MSKKVSRVPGTDVRDYRAQQVQNARIFQYVKHIKEVFHIMNLEFQFMLLFPVVKFGDVVMRFYHS
jgi:hypothetical protein